MMFRWVREFQNLMNHHTNTKLSSTWRESKRKQLLLFIVLVAKSIFWFLSRWRFCFRSVVLSFSWCLHQIMCPQISLREPSDSHMKKQQSQGEETRWNEKHFANKTQSYWHGIKVKRWHVWLNLSHWKESFPQECNGKETWQT